MANTKNKRQTRHKRIRARISGNSKRPRLCVFRSSSHIYAQIIDDLKSKTLLSLSDKGIKGNKTEKAVKVGKEIAKLALEKKIDQVVFDRGGYRYHGRVKALADGARQGGLKF